MEVLDLLGRRARLPIVRLAAPGAILDGDLLLPNREVPDGARIGDILDVFVHLDSDDRPIATTAMPRIALGEVTFLEVTATTQIGAFVDWGLGKELLVPFAEHATEMFVGDRHPIGLYLDKSDRLAGTMYVREMLATYADRRVAIGEWIEGEAWRNDPDIGLFVILEKRFVGLVPASEPHGARRGDPVRARIAHIQPDGKLVLSLRPLAHKAQASDAELVLERLAGPNAPRVGDHSDPELLRAVFGLSKKAFKRAVGHLLKTNAVAIDRDGFVILRRT